MIKFHVIDDTVDLTNYMRDWTANLMGSNQIFFLEVTSANQDIPPKCGGKKDLQCLDDFLDIIEYQEIKVCPDRSDDGWGVVAYLRTRPIQKLNLPDEEPEEKPVEKPKGLLARIFRRSETAKPERPISGTVEQVFDVDFGGLPTYVTGTKTDRGVSYEIIINATRDAVNKIKKYQKLDLTDNDSLSMCNRDADLRRKQRKMADVLDSLAGIYDRLGITSGNLVLDTIHWRDTIMKSHKDLRARGIRGLDHLSKIGNCAFYNAVYPQKERHISEFDDEMARILRQAKKPSIPVIDKSKDPERGLSSAGNFTFDDIAGNEDAIHFLKGALRFFRDPDEYRKMRGLDLAPGCILYGPPGTGKTMLARALANEAKVDFIEYDASTIMSKWYGESSSNLAQLIDRAKGSGKCVLFVDEFEQLGRERADSHEASAKLVDALNIYLTSENRGDVFLVGATNIYGQIDPALKSRLPGVEVPLPTAEALAAMARNQVCRHSRRVEISPFAEGTDYDAIGRAAYGLDGRALVAEDQGIFRALCNDFYDALQDGKDPAKVTTQDWLDRIADAKPKQDRIGFSKK